jgi:uncharacterized OsmC-like protein
MSTLEKIKTALERNAKAVELRPGVGQGTAVTKVKLTDGFTCEITDGPWRLVADMAEKHGGNNAGPNPGVLGRAALGSCLAISYVMWAAKLGVPISQLEVEVQADYDVRGEYGLADMPPGYKEVRYIVNIASPATEEEIIKLLDLADAHTPYLDIFRRPIAVRREVQIQSSEK